MKRKIPIQIKAVIQLAILGNFHKKIANPITKTDFNQGHTED